MTEQTKELIDKYGNQAYYMAVKFTVIAVNLRDEKGIKIFSECSQELLRLGYHKYEKKEN